MYILFINTESDHLNVTEASTSIEYFDHLYYQVPNEDLRGKILCTNVIGQLQERPLNPYPFINQVNQ